MANFDAWKATKGFLRSKSVSVCVRGTPFLFDPEDAERVAKWERLSKKTLVRGDVVSVKIRPREEKEGKKRTPVFVRYATSARRTDVRIGDRWPLQGALIAFDPNNGELKAMIGSKSAEAVRA